MLSENVGEGPDKWCPAAEFRGVTTAYRHDTAGRLWLRTEGVMEDVSLVEAVAMWKEIDLFQNWFPLCAASPRLASPRLGA